MMASYPVTVVAGGLYHCDRRWTTASPQPTEVHRVYLPLNGRARVALGSRWTDLVPGLLYFIPAHPAFSHACDLRMDVHWMHLRIDDPELARLGARVGAVTSWPAATWRWIEPALAGLGAHLAGGGLALEAAVHAAAIAVTAAAVNPEGIRSERVDAAHARFDPALALIQRQYPASVRAPVLARAVGMSEVHFRRAFRQAFGVPPHAYLTRLRLDAAVSRLAGSAVPVSTIAAECGFPDAFYFSRAFKRHFRVSPQAFRLERRRAP